MVPIWQVSLGLVVVGLTIILQGRREISLRGELARLRTRLNLGEGNERAEAARLLRARALEVARRGRHLETLEVFQVADELEPRQRHAA